MGRKSHTRTLAVWANGERVATWQAAGRGPAELRYEPSWLASPLGRPLSLSLPLALVGNEPLRGPVVENYFHNLLPENDNIRRRLAARYAAGSQDPFDLLAAIGRDCVGAIQLLAEGISPEGFNRIEGTAMTDDDVARLLRNAAGTALPGKQDADWDFRISIAGAQEKTALLRHGNRWMAPHGATPTTHILKMPLGLVGNMQADMRTSVYNEWLCLRLLDAFGVPVAHAEIVTFADHPAVLAVERFDRRLHESQTWITRLPQEDFCQALGISPDQKYEADGGPGILDVARILAGSERARGDLKTLLRSQILFWLMAATDGHAKNFSIHLMAGGRFHLTPLYDVLSAWPVIGKGKGKHHLPLRRVKLAMAIRGSNPHYELATIMRRHFDALAARAGWGASADDLIEELLDQVEPAIETVSHQIPNEFPQDIAHAIFEGVRSQALRLDSQ
ncbi:type II toxin-antitoxin system HipA family toxin [Caenimonas sp. SL110]|uniref:type II toxin-antitoxin system HipA family toxin n=1 Tax=Caenimonas sp. SL110 TaxID=1450524 RepID=UPI000652EC83|nr:type II toxin-antitoxin system HipA family toxin [Caenimonas sp. SL110]